MNQQDEKQYVRELAFKVKEFTDSLNNKLIIERWKNVNELRKTDRFPIWCNPVTAWGEILPLSDLKCSSTIARNIEYQLRKTLFKMDVNDDTPLMDYYEISPCFDIEPKNVWGVEVERHNTNPGGAWGYIPALSSPEDVKKLIKPQYRLNEEKTNQSLEAYSDILDGIFPVKLSCFDILGATFGSYLADLMGMSQMMENMLLEPEFVHDVMKYLRDSAMQGLDYIEEQKLITRNNNTVMTLSDDFGDINKDGTIGLKNCWIMTNSQEYDQVSPSMWEEFCLEYQRPILNRFGRVAYGCCENLTNKIDGVMSIENLRMFVCSAWTDLSKVVSAVEDKKTIMWRQKASEVLFEDDLVKMKNKLKEGLKTLEDCHAQIVLREIETLNNRPKRLHDWVNIAKEACQD